ncbi:histidine phosphatase superfamily [Schizophyllum commune]
MKYLHLAVLPATVVAASQNILYSPNSYSFNPLKHLSGIAPYFSAQDPGLTPKPPQGCNVTGAAYLVRHAAIYANDFDYESYIEPFVDKLENTSDVDWTATSGTAAPLAFLSNWKSPIEDPDLEQLTKIGVLESMSLGIELARRYPALAPPKKVWTSTAERTVLSAKSLISGLDRYSNQTELVQVPEGEEEGADSLTPYKACPAYSSSRGSEQSSAFRDQYTKPIVARLKATVPGFNWTSEDVYGMQQLCGYESVIRGESHFCSLDLFTPNEWLAFEYANDLMYFHNIGYGNALSGTLGYPWVNASAQALLTGDALHVSFTHRELPPTVLVALGLFNNTAFSGGDNQNATMPTDAINHRRAWRSSSMLTFLTNIAIEKLSCSSYGFDGSEFYRVLVNDSPQPLQDCDDGPGESCARDSFESWVTERGQRFGGFSDACGVDYDNSTNTLTIYDQ